MSDAPIIQVLKENPKLLSFYLKTDDLLTEMKNGKNVSIEFLLTAAQFLGSFVQIVSEQERPNEFAIMCDQEDLEKINSTLKLPRRE